MHFSQGKNPCQIETTTKAVNQVWGTFFPSNRFSVPSFDPNQSDLILKQKVAKNHTKVTQKVTTTV